MYFGLLSYLIPFFIVGACVLAFILLALKWTSIRNGTTNWKNVILLWILGGWFLGTALITLMPFTFGDTNTRVLSIIPFRELITGGPGVGYAVVKEGLANILLFTVGGALCALSWKRSTARTVLALTFFAVGIETGQYILNIGRISSIDDVIWASIGAFLGAYLVNLRIMKSAQVSALAPNNSQ